MNQDAIDLISLLELRGNTRLIKVANSQGGEYHGPCPFCGKGTNRFFVQPNAERPHYCCRICGMKGDAIQFLRDYEGLSYHAACQELDLDPKYPATRNPEPVQTPDDPPCQAWQQAGMDFIARAEKFLWLANAPESVKMLEYLHVRGFSDDTMKRARLGYCPLGKDGKWFSCSFETWGLTPDMLSPEQLAKEVIRIPPGIIIPWIVDGILWKIAIKRPGEEQGYGQVLGSREGLYNASGLCDVFSDGKPIVMVEGEFDALSVLQVAGDLVTPVATGSVSRARTQRWITALGTQDNPVLQSFDTDQAGEDGAAWWIAHYECSALRTSNIMRWKPAAHDCNDMLQAGMNIRRWLKFGLETAVRPVMVVAPTVLQKEVVIPLVPVQEYQESDLKPCNEVYCAVGYDERGQPFCEKCRLYNPAPAPAPAMISDGKLLPNRCTTTFCQRTVRCYGAGGSAWCVECWKNVYIPSKPNMEHLSLSNYTT